MEEERSRAAMETMETANLMASAIEKDQQQTQLVAQKIFAAAQPGAVFGEPVVQGAYTVITASEVKAGGGFGLGRSFGPAAPRAAPSEAGAPPASAPAAETLGGGGGGGGWSEGRPVAIVVIGPQGVQVRPVVDVTKLLIAVVSAWIGIGAALARARRR